MKVDSGSHPLLYKIGVNLAKKDPKLFDFGLKALTFPEAIIGKAKFAFSNKEIGDRINSVNFELTVLCNLRCEMCWWWGQNGIGFKLVENKDSMITKQMSKEEVFKIVDELAVKHRPSFYLSGGEPFVREDTIDIIEYIANKGLSIITNDNGTLLKDEWLKRLAKIKKLTINFSIDGPRDVHDKIRGKGNYDKTTNNIKKLLEYRGDSIFPAIKTNTTFSPFILGRIDEMIRELQDNIGVDATRLQHLWFTDKEHAEAHKKVLHDSLGTNEGANVDSHIISLPERNYVEALADEILKIEHTKYKKPVYIHPRMNKADIIRYYFDLNYVRAPRCMIAWNSIFIRANGDVMFCPDEWMVDFKLGNIREHSIDELWNNEKAKQFRKELWNHKLYPGCARCCSING
ncbi:MAG: radical SAM protein [Candidatus Micrarchaeia archaeon]